MTRPAVTTALAPSPIVGVSAAPPSSPAPRLHATGFWRDILGRRDLITDVPPTHWLIEDYYDPIRRFPTRPTPNAARSCPVDFDALGWGVPPSIVPATDTVAAPRADRGPAASAGRRARTKPWTASASR
jgi:hypothetical protein